MHKHEELGGARVHVGRIDPARLEEANRQADVEASRERVGLDELDAASVSVSLYWYARPSKRGTYSGSGGSAQRATGWLSSVEVEDDEPSQSIAG